MALNQVPVDLLKLILHDSSIYTLKQCYRTCRLLYTKIMTVDFLTRRFVFNDFPNPLLVVLIMRIQNAYRLKQFVNWKKHVDRWKGDELLTYNLNKLICRQPFIPDINEFIVEVPINIFPLTIHFLNIRNEFQSVDFCIQDIFLKFVSNGGIVFTEQIGGNFCKLESSEKTVKILVILDYQTSEMKFRLIINNKIILLFRVSEFTKKTGVIPCISTRSSTDNIKILHSFKDQEFLEKHRIS